MGGRRGGLQEVCRDMRGGGGSRTCFVTVRFAVQNQYSSLLSYAALPAEGGTLTFSGLHGGYDGADTVVGGVVVTFRARPAAGWAVAAWEGDVGEDCAPDLECTARAYTDLFVTVHFCDDGAGGTRDFSGGRAGRNGDRCGLDRRRLRLCRRHAHLSGRFRRRGGLWRLGRGTSKIAPRRIWNAR